MAGTLVFFRENRCLLSRHAERAIAHLNRLLNNVLSLLIHRGEIAYTIAQIARFCRPAQKLSKGDFEDERKMDGLAALFEMVRRTLGIELTAEHFAAEGLCTGADYIRRLAHPDQILTVLLFAGVYVGQRGSVHLMTPDSATTQDYEEIFRQILVPLKIPVERVGKRAPTTARSITLGTQEEFAAASSRPDGALSSPSSPGSLAVVVGPGSDFLSRDFMRRYTRLAEV